MFGFGVKIDLTKFNQTMREYVRVSKRSLAEICNQKAKWIAIFALNLTPKTAQSRIEQELGIVVKEQVTSKRGKVKTKRKAQLVQGKGGPRLALIINARRGKAGKPGLNRGKMNRAILAALGARKKSKGFLAIGWWAAIKKLTTVIRGNAGGPRPDRSVKVRGKEKGRATIAKDFAFMCHSIIENSVRGGKRLKARVSMLINKYAQQAVNKEEQSMRAYIDKKLKADADKFSKG